MPMKSQTMFRYKQRKPNETDIVQVPNFSKTQAYGNWYRKERCPNDCQNTYQVNDVAGNVRTCPKVIGGSKRCIPLNANTAINADVPTNEKGQLTKKYYTSNTEYMQARCMTYKQKQFNFVRNESESTLEANCCGNDAGYVTGNCKTVIYKPNNKPFSTQGAVSSSTRLLRLKYNAVTRPPTGVQYPPKYNNNSNMVKTNICSSKTVSRQKKTVC